MSKYNHPEAYCLMKYFCKSCHTSEILWNSRDGVTPFIIRCKWCGGEASHIDWDKDQCNPNYTPMHGQRVFIDLPPNINDLLTRIRINRFWEHPQYPMKDMFESKEVAFTELTKSYKSTDPYIITV